MRKYYSKAQLNAISRAISEKREKERQVEIDERGLRDVWEYQTVYKRSWTFLNASDEKLQECKERAIDYLVEMIRFWDERKQTNHDRYIRYSEALKRLRGEAK